MKMSVRSFKFRLVGLVILKRLRFIAVLAAVGLFIGYWDTVMNYWEKWTQWQGAASRRLEPGEEFYCPMDPQVVRSTYEPNGEVPKCPICGMPLSIRKKGASADLPEGITGRVQLSPERIQLAGIKTATTGYRPMAKQTKTVGYVAFDESRLSRIVSRVDGYIEKLYVNETYTVVHKGDPLAEIYSPELYSTARELVLATRSGGAADLAAAAKAKLQLLGVSRQEIDGIAGEKGTGPISAQHPPGRSGKLDPSPFSLVIRSPQEGYVVDKKIVVGASVEAKMTLFEVADLSTVWIEAEVYEKDIPFLQVGQKIEATVEAYPNRVFTGKLALVYPQLETATRTDRVRLTLDNPQHELRPGMFAAVRIDTPLETIEPYRSAAAEIRRVASAGAPPRYEFLCVPERAIIDTGSKKLVYVEREPGVFEGVEVELGPRDDGYYPVIKGLRPGDKMAAAGGFLIDAETRLNPAAASTYFGASGGPQSGTMRATTPNTRPRPPVAPGGGAEPGGDTKGATNGRGFFAPEDLENINQLPEADRKLALTQGCCPVTGAALGSMGVPVKIILRGRPVFLCCEGCVAEAQQNPDETLKKLAAAARGMKRPAAEPGTPAAAEKRKGP
jgi:Cu(I)/Ag(I) efflux system membrane fusion protein